MSLLQFAIGALNDVVDAPYDAGRKPGKPVAAGLVPPVVAMTVAAGAATGGFVLAAASGPGTVLLAGVGLAIGVAYDLRAKGTTWSWLPFALGIPLLPVYGWYGATGGLPPAFAALVPIAALEGAALAVANALADLERDRAAGTQSVATRLGEAAAGRSVVALQVLVAAGAVTSAAALGSAAGLPAVVAAGVVLAAVTGASPTVAGRGARWRETAWEAQAVAAGVLGVAWTAAVAAGGSLVVP